MKKSTFNLAYIAPIILVLTPFIIFIVAIQKPNKDETKANLYPASMIVTYVNQEEDTVGLQDFNGQRWVFYGAEDWAVNDICACIMNDMGTDIVYDDEIVETRYCGWVE